MTHPPHILPKPNQHRASPPRPFHHRILRRDPEGDLFTWEKTDLVDALKAAVAA